MAVATCISASASTHGRDPKRARAFEDPRLWLDLSQFLGLYEGAHPPERADGTPVIYIFTHDSVGLGEDGPTHQPVEQLVALRSIPGLITLRPADANEVAEAWRVIMCLEHRPSCLVLTRQPLPTFDRKRFASAAGVARGAYVMADAERAKPAVILMGTGSEVALCVEAYEALKQEGIAARVVSMPSWELFEQQDQAYRDSVLPPDVKARVSVEAGFRDRLGPLRRRERIPYRMHTFGASAPIKDVMAKFGFTRGHAREGSCRRQTTARFGQGGGSMNALKQLEACGQSPWLDYLKRSLIESGELRTLIERDGLKGVTSNPSIFEKAIAETGEYDEALKQFQAKADHSISAIYEHLAIADIRAAASVLHPVYRDTNGRDGYISLECSPYLANDTDATVAERCGYGQPWTNQTSW